MTERQLGDSGLLAAIFTRRCIELVSEHPPKLSGTIESVVESDGRDRPVLMRPRLQSARASLEPAAQNVARHGFVLIRENMMDVAGRYLAGLRNASRRQLRIIQVRMDVLHDADSVRRSE